ncbi:hypothetical protein [Kitasatospora atroaurantiaca]|nr:hypothetical protein [Kitasatospora atroaurantiaca]
MPSAHAHSGRGVHRSVRALERAVCAWGANRFLDSLAAARRIEGT